MTRTIEITTEEEITLQRKASALGLDLDAYLRRLVALAAASPADFPRYGPADLASLMEAWIAEDATEDEEELARRDASWEQLRGNLEGDRLTLRVPDVSPHD